ncbi:MAG: AraC family transcriptional regulator [Pseudomonadota bacterium]|nr:AraC family transcriptional regulator [Pseudomonadota bacterium]
MDALSQILDDVYLSRAEYVYTMAQEPWHLQLDSPGAVVFHIVMTGEMQLKTQEDQHPLILQTGDMVFLPQGRTHYAFSHPKAQKLPPHQLDKEFQGHRNDPVVLYHTRAETLILTVRCELDIEMARPLLSALPDSLIIRSMTDQGAPEWLKIGLQFLALEAERHRPGRYTLLNRLVGMMFIECIRDYVEQLPETSDSWLSALADPQLAPVLSAIHAQPEYTWTVAELAGLACMSRSGFAERFGQVMGQPPLSYLSAHRLRLAAWNLRENQHSVSRISQMIGYGSETAFSQAFKRQYGKTPSQYRKEFQKELC